jgi:hypothetical protein
MSSKLFPTLATIAIAMSAALASTAMAVEATPSVPVLMGEVTQFVDQPANTGRARAHADEQAGPAKIVLMGEVTQFIDQPANASRALARAGEQAGAVKVVLMGEVTQFVDQPGVRSREDVRTETLTALGASRIRK